MSLARSGVGVADELHMLIPLTLTGTIAFGLGARGVTGVPPAGWTTPKN